MIAVRKRAPNTDLWPFLAQLNRPVTSAGMNSYGTGDYSIVKIVKAIAPLVLTAALLTLAGCGHKLVAHGGDTTVPVYPDKASFDRLKSMQSQGGPAGLIGGMGASLVAKRVDDGTPIKVDNCDDQGCEIEVLDGASKGLKGYVAKDAVD